MRCPGFQSAETSVENALEIEIITTTQKLEQLKPEWERLRKLHNAPTIFLDHAYVMAWWSSFGSEATQYTFVVRRSGTVVAIFPFMKTRWTVSGVPIRRVSFIINAHVLRSDALVADDAGVCIAAVLRHLRRDRWSWDIFDLENIPENSVLYPLLMQAAQQNGFAADEWRRARTHRLLPVVGTWDEYLRGRSGNFRWQIKKFRKRLEAHGNPEVERIYSRAAMLAFLPQLFELEKRSWQGQGSHSSMGDADLKFCELLFSDMPEDRLGEFWAMRINGRLVAAITLLRLERVLYVFTTYYDPDLASASPGTLLYFEMLKSAWERGEKAVDFNGDSAAFQRWTSEGINHFRLRIYSRNWFGRALYCARNHFGFRAPAVIDNAA